VSVPRAVKWLIVAIAAVALVTMTVVWATRDPERTYYGRHTNVLAAGERVVLMRDFATDRGRRVISGTSAVVKSDPAWDEDSCYPDRPISITLSSDKTSLSVPRNLLQK